MHETCGFRVKRDASRSWISWRCMTWRDEHAQKEYLAQIRLVETVYELLKLGWTPKDILEKVNRLLIEFK